MHPVLVWCYWKGTRMKWPVRVGLLCVLASAPPGGWGFLLSSSWFLPAAPSGWQEGLEVCVELHVKNA